ncbi:cytochrome c [Bacillus sp. DNRA2]|uniref:cytochrome c550 n=1 Tax=Bacillus sp. DNRA2 TaxID=2723053 RepID=UPI00145F3C8B|nr:cytochrome c [Bacillus sp. DNRA2]NMD71879.1 cytochrome c [Bacillus sp. DNRA2]
MNRNPIIPFVVIMVFGIGLMFLLSFKGLGDQKEVAKEAANGGKTEEVAAATPEDLYKKSCVACHGADYSGGVGPTLKGVSKKRDDAYIKDIITNGKNNMPPGLVKADQADDMVKWLKKL